MATPDRNCELKKTTKLPTQLPFISLDNLKFAERRKWNFVI
jgi:hypothetical protein